MGRLRNWSESLKAATFNHANHSPSSSPTLVNNDSLSTTNLPKKEVPSTVREASASSIPQVNSAASQLGYRSSSRPVSMMYTPPMMETGKDNHVEELVPVFSFLSSHGNKLYQEGYFLKLNDLDTNGKPTVERNWTECFAQLVGTILSLWDAAALDAAGQDGEVAPTFVNLADASIKMIETLPTRNPDVQPLQNVLSISTAGKNRYLLHFNSLHSLTQWTAGIRLAMFEHTSLQELYTGSLIAGKGKYLNNIRVIMEKTKFRTEDWARVRFGAGTPWRRCWYVIEPPDEKEWQRATKTFKKRSVYERPAYPKGDIKFYDTKKTKKATPIATITDAYSAYAIYPQSKPLIDQSTLVKVEGRITIHSNPESKTEGFVFVMPEVHPAVSGFEMMLRWLFPVYDCFSLYGRPNRLIADTLDARGLMFAMPQDRRYGYLDIIDVAALIHTDGNEKWGEREWRKHLKDMTAKRMSAAVQTRTSSTLGSKHVPRPSTSSRNGVQYDDNVSVRSASSNRHQHNQSTDAVFAPTGSMSPPPAKGPYQTLVKSSHSRSVSESVALSSPSKNRRQKDGHVPSRLSMDREGVEPVERSADTSPYRPAYGIDRANDLELADSANSSDSDLHRQHTNPEDVTREMGQNNPPAPVAAPPSFQHRSSDRPQKRPDVRPDLRREKSRMSNGTLSQMVDASRMATGTAAGAAATAAWKSGRTSEDNGQRGVNQNSAAWKSGRASEDNGQRGVNQNSAAWKSGRASEDNGQRGVNQTPDVQDGMSANQNGAKALVGNASPYERMSRESSNGQISQYRQPSEHSATRQPVPRSDSAHSITRKPVPLQMPPVPTNLAWQNSRENVAQFRRSGEDFDSDTSPDYASTHKSEDNKSEKSVRKARTGVLKTVGSSQLPANPGPAAVNNDIPAVDFGVTRSLTPGPSWPSTTGHSGRKSPLFQSASTPASTPGQISPYESRNPFEGSTPVENKRSSYLRQSSTPPALSRSSTYAWQPGAVPGSQSPGATVTPEQFVQQQAAHARVPSGYVPHRTVSTGNIEQVSSGPQKLQKKRDSYVRPSSRNSLIQDYSSNLSAREQEHVARVTGGPLVNVPERSRTPDPSIGLIGAIEAREQERRNMKEGVSGHMVQAAIAQRQQHAQAQQMQAQQAAERAYAQQYYGPVIDARQNGQWISQPPQGYWNGAPQHQQPPHQPQWQNQAQFQPNYNGYYNTRDGYGYGQR